MAQQVQDRAHRIFSEVLTDTILPNLRHYDVWRITPVLLSIFGEGTMFRMTETAHVTIQHIDTITRAQSENFIEELVLMEFLTELATNIPERFIELIQMDTLSIINAQLEEIIGQRHIAPRRERRQFLEEQATDLEEMLEGVVPRRETEYYELDYEEYQDNEETRSRFVLVYHE